VKTGTGKYYEKLKPYYVQRDEKDNTLIFESRFESGNLRRAFKMYIIKLKF
jgi:hypothetical protein